MSYTLLDYALTSVANVKTYLGETSTSYDDLFGMLIDECTEWIEDHCGDRRFYSDKDNTHKFIDITEYHDGTGKKTLQLRRFPVISVTSVSYATGDLNNKTWNALDPKTQYTFNPITGELTMISVPCGVQNVRIVYSAGYVRDTADGGSLLPKNLEMACIKMVAKEYNRRRSQGITRESIGGGSIEWNENMDASVKDKLESYKRRSF